MKAPEIFGQNVPLAEAKIALIPVHWDVTTSYGRGTYYGPQTIAEASPQLDYFDYDFGSIIEKGIHLFEKCETLDRHYKKAEPKARKVIEFFDKNPSEAANKEILELQQLVNDQCDIMVNNIHDQSRLLLDKHIVGVVGGDHSCPLGLIKAIGEKYDGDFGILHIDAHADLRIAYQGFKHSHASIMYNALQLEKAPNKLVQVGIRDFCQEEKEIIDYDERIKTYFGPQIFANTYSGIQWQQQCEEMLNQLPDKVYISFDIDGLNPEFCPNTGTPVPGGLSFSQAEHLMRVFKKLNKQLVGFDLCEVAPSSDPYDQWDGNVGARVLYKLCGLV